MAVATLPMDGLPGNDRNGEGDARRPLAWRGMLLVGSALLTAGASFAVLTGLTPLEPEGAVVPLVMLLNGAFVLMLGWLIGREIWSLWTARRLGEAASKLHVRLVTLFSVVAVVPAILVALLASLTLNQGLDRWFEIRTTQIVDASVEVASAYVEENARNLQGQTLSMAAALDSARSLYRLDRRGFQTLMDQQARGRGLLGASLLRRTGATELAASTGAENPRPVPPLDAIADADKGRPILISPGDTDLVGAVVRLNELDLYLYTVRLIDPRVMEAQRLMRDNSDDYYALQDGQTQFKIAFALLYLGVCFIVLLAAIWTGLSLADRLVRPISRLITAADEVSHGNLDAFVDPRGSDGDLRALSDTFNGMTGRLRAQREELLEARDHIDERRRFSEAVLSGVSAGVVGIAPDGSVSSVNSAAEQLLSPGAPGSLVGRGVTEVLPELTELVEGARRGRGRAVRAQAAIRRAGRERILNAQITTQGGSADRDGDQAFVLTLDDITDLVAAQRSTAWADVARRIAHEIKNPLTPIQLSAERLNRRYGRKLTEDREVFDQCTGTIVRQVEDIKRMVDEFSSFARMPKPKKEAADLREIVGEAAFLIEMARNDIRFDVATGDAPIQGSFDKRLLGQAIGNVIKNATEAIDAVPDRAGRIAVIGRQVGEHAVLDVIDNGKGLPKEDRQKLLEPYVTNREKGTGLGLAIVKKIVEDHGGAMELHDAPPAFEDGVGAMVRFWLPLAAPAGADQHDDAEAEAPATPSDAAQADRSDDGARGAGAPPPREARADNEQTQPEELAHDGV